MGQYDRKAQSERKHGPIFSSSTSRGPLRPPPVSKPEWRGSGYTKKAKPKPHLDAPKRLPEPQDQLIALELQQLVLNIFKDAFLGQDSLDRLGGEEGLKEVLREVNEMVGKREWEDAFGDEERRVAYAGRWGPSRAVAYANVLASLCENSLQDWMPGGSLSTSASKAICFGGGAAEVMAFVALLRHLRPQTAGVPQSENASTTEETDAKPALLDLQLIDSSDWGTVISSLETGSTQPPLLSKYASASARASNSSFLSPSRLSISFTQQDIFELSVSRLKEMIGEDQKPVLVTLFMTLNHLYNTSIPKTSLFLKKLDAVLPLHSTIVVVDVIGAAATTATPAPLTTPTPSTSTSTPTPDPEEEVTGYTLPWLISRVLIGKPAETAPVKTTGKGKKAIEEEEAKKVVPRWENAVEQEMKINRLDDKLRYPGSLENVKFQVLSFRRV